MTTTMIFLNEGQKMIYGRKRIMDTFYKTHPLGKDILEDEKPVIDFAYACVVAIKDIHKGEALSLDNIWVKRPGTGEIFAKDFENVLGKVATVDISENTQLSYFMFK